MLKKTLVCVSVLACFCLGLVSFAAADNGPETIVLKTTKDMAKKPKTVNFPHKAHQERANNDCGVCHHSKGDDGKQVAYVEGQKIEKCESCHFKGSGMANKKVETFQKAAHVRCKDCHKKEANANADLKKKLKGCSCHKYNQ